MPTGTVTAYSGPAGHGLIAADDDGAVLFVHRGSILLAGTTLAVGERVEFAVQAGGMGVQAVDVQPLVGGA